MSEQNKAIVKDFFDIANKEMRTPVELCTPDFTAHIGGYPEMDLQTFQQYQKKYYAAFSNTSITIEDMIAEDNRVAFRGVVQATHTSEFNNIPASGKQIKVPIIGIAHLFNGRIAKWWNLPDRLSWMQQIGAIPA